MQQHQVDVRIGREIPATVSAMSDKRDGRSIDVQTLARRLDQPQDDRINRIGPSKTDLWSGGAGGMEIRSLDARLSQLSTRFDDLGMERGQVRLCTRRKKITTRHLLFHRYGCVLRSRGSIRISFHPRSALFGLLPQWCR